MAGYSGTPLVRKLGIKPGHTLAVVDGPTGFAVPDLPDGVEPHSLGGAGAEPIDVVVSFHTERSHLESRLPDLMRSLAVDGGLWIAWPKRASGTPTDLTEDVVREVAVPTGLVDNKVCAIDGTWSGLRLVLRKELRPGRRTAAG